MLVGPTAVGKSTLMNEVVKLDAEFARVSGFTTRQPRDNDEPGMYRYVSSAVARRMIEQDDVVQFAIHPTTGDIYGTQLVDYPKTFNLLDTLSTVVDGLQSMPFQRTVTVSVTTEPAAWQAWLLDRYPQASEERTNRLEEARQSIEWSMQQRADHFWLVNRPNDLATTAQELIAIVHSGTGTSEPPHQAQDLLNSVNSLLSYE